MRFSIISGILKLFSRIPRNVTCQVSNKIETIDEFHLCNSIFKNSLRQNLKNKNTNFFSNVKILKFKTNADLYSTSSLFQTIPLTCFYSNNKFFLMLQNDCITIFRKIAAFHTFSRTFYLHSKTVFSCSTHLCSLVMNFSMFH